MYEIPPIVTYCIFFLNFFVALFFLILFIKSKFKKRMGKGTEEDITFVLPCYNVAGVLEKSVKSIKNLDYNQDSIKIILVDDGSKDNTLEVARRIARQYKNIMVLAKKNGGRADALNYGLKRVKTEFAAVLDSDTILSRDLLKKAMSLFLEPSIIAVTGRTKPANTNGFLGKMQEVEYAFAAFNRKLQETIRTLPTVPAFTIFKREFLVKHGYFDVGNLTEDFEMGLRIQKHHYDIGFVADSCSLTYVPDTFRGLLRQRIRWAYGTLYNAKKYKNLFFNREYGDLGFFNLPTTLFGVFIMSLIFLFSIYSLISWAFEHAQMFSAGWLPTFGTGMTQLLIAFTDLRIILFIISILVGLALFFIVKYELKEKIKIGYYLIFITIYLWLLAFFYIATFPYILIRITPKW